MIPVVLDSDAQILHFGAEQRLATPTQRHALYLLDRGCTFPGCTTPAPWCQTAHTGAGYATTRTTTTDELALLCGYHHRLADTQNWHLQRRHGRIWITPPPWIDPHQTPRTNEHFTPLRV